MKKIVRSKKYNYDFDMQTGVFIRWGKTIQDDPTYSPFGPEILDLEVSDICSKGCSWCYKSNKAIGKNMSFDTFKNIFDKIPKNLTQIAFGVGDIDANPDLWKIMEYCRENNVIPNITINGERMTPELYNNLVKYCGAVAVSRYENKNICYDVIKELTERGLKQCNIHALVSAETYDRVLETIDDTKTDEKLFGLNAIVLLSLKKTGRGINFTPLAFDKFENLVMKAFYNEINVGFDSCSCGKFLKVISKRPEYKYMEKFCEACESFGNFSSYISVEGKYFPCSFCEGLNLFPGIDVINCENFLKDVWFSEQVSSGRRMMEERFFKGNFECPVFEV